MAITEGQQTSTRDKALPEKLVDPDYIASLAYDTWQRLENETEVAVNSDIDYESNWRELTRTDVDGPWENASNFHVPLTLTYGKAIHARLWQMFSNPGGFFSVNARTEVFKDREVTIQHFMNWVLTSFANGGLGARRELDRWLWDVVFNGSGYLKLYWKTEKHEYRDLEPVVVTEEETVYRPGQLTGVVNSEMRVEEREVDKVDMLSTPQIRRVNKEDVALPTGYHDPQDAPYYVNRCTFSNDQLKEKVQSGLFYEDAVQSVLGQGVNPDLDADVRSQVKHDRKSIDGIETNWGENREHIVLEYVGPAYVMKDVMNQQELDNEVTKTKHEIVAWVHKENRTLLGWTYLKRISPDGTRPLFKSDYMTFPNRSDGVGVAELTYDANRYVDGLTNMRMDNGWLSSMPMFAYRNTSNSLKPHQMRVRPGAGIPVDDINDIKQFSFPFLSNFGYQEQAQVVDWQERLLAISDLTLGRAPEKVGALRNATGSNLIAQESGIQLQIHFDRIAYCMNQVLQYLFKMCRERIPETLYFRVTGERGEPVFGKVDREHLKGEYDFDISIDILSQSQIEKQQQAVLLMQTMVNPAYTQTGNVTPENIYNLLKNFLKANRVARVDDYITKPQGYQEPRVSAHERLSRIMVGQLAGLEDTVRMDEDHEKAIADYEAFKASELYGLLVQPAQVSALERLIQAHQQMLMAVQAGGNPNMQGMQIPREGFSSPDASSQLLGNQPGAPSGPII